MIDLLFGYDEKLEDADPSEDKVQRTKEGLLVHSIENLRLLLAPRHFDTPASSLRVGQYDIVKRECVFFEVGAVLSGGPFAECKNTYSGPAHCLTKVHSHHYRPDGVASAERSRADDAPRLHLGPWAPRSRWHSRCLWARRGQCLDSMEVRRQRHRSARCARRLSASAGV